MRKGEGDNPDLKYGEKLSLIFKALVIKDSYLHSSQRVHALQTTEQQLEGFQKSCVPLSPLHSTVLEVLIADLTVPS